MIEPRLPNENASPDGADPAHRSRAQSRGEHAGAPQLVSSDGNRQFVSSDGNRQFVSSDGNRQFVHVLDADRSLGAALTDAELGTARRHAVAEVAELAAGVYSPRQLFAGDRLLGLLVLEGLLVCQVEVADRRSGELVGAGAVLRPWDDFGHAATIPFMVHWRVIQHTRMALLDRRFLLTIAHWPALIDAFVERISGHAQTLALNAAIQCLQQVNARLLVLFWHFADRFGRVTPDGVHLPLPLSHADLAELVGAARPTVSIALRQLAETGHIWRSEDRTWMLSKDPPELSYIRRPRASELPGLTR
jgi:CRP-like cAMP-binding protein